MTTLFYVALFGILFFVALLLILVWRDKTVHNQDALDDAEGWLLFSLVVTGATDMVAWIMLFGWWLIERWLT